jgi:hypothetical protein
MAFPMEPVWLPGCSGSVRPTACRRCGSSQIRALGYAGSTVLWFACHGCSHVWSLREIREDDLTPWREPPPMPFNQEH